jgi:hypothetical protein
MGFVYVMAFTASHLSEARNVIASLRRAEPAHHPRGTILAYSDLEKGDAAQLTERWGVQNFQLSVPMVDMRKAVASWGSSAFSRIVVGKFMALLDALQRHPDAHIVWLDTDLYFFADPRGPLMRHFALSPGAVLLQRSRGDRACTGFFALPPGDTARSAQRRLLKNAHGRLMRHILSRAAGYKGDEACINEELKTKAFRFALLPSGLFPNGHDYFTRKVATSRTVLVHNNFISGLESKIARFKAHGLWLPEAEGGASGEGPARLEHSAEGEAAAAEGESEAAAAEEGDGGGVMGE